MENSIVWRHENGAIKVPICGKVVPVQRELLSSTPPVSTPRRRKFDGSFSSLLRSLSAEVCRRVSAGWVFSLIPDHLEDGAGGSVGLRREPARGGADVGLRPTRLGAGGGVNIWVEVRRWSSHRGSSNRSDGITACTCACTCTLSHAHPKRR